MTTAKRDIEKLRTNAIDIEGYLLEYELLNYDKWNLWRVSIVAEGSNKGTETLKNIGWSITLKRAITKIADEKIWTEKKTRNLHDYIEEHYCEIDKICAVILGKLQEDDSEIT